MVTMVAERVLVDTNVLIHSSVAGSPFHAQARAALNSLHDARCMLCVTRQVLREYLAALSRPQSFANPHSWSVLADDVRRFERQFVVIEEDAEVTAGLLDLGQRLPVGGAQVHDANLVAAMLAAGVGAVLTFNLNDFRRFEHLVRVLDANAALPQ